MSQKEFLRGLHAEIAADFVDEGLADIGTYTAPGGPTLPCTLMIGHDIARVGQVAVVNDRTKVLTLFKSEVGSPIPKAVVVTGTDTYTLIDRVLDDDSRSIWTARHG